MKLGAVHPDSDIARAVDTKLTMIITSDEQDAPAARKQRQAGKVILGQASQNAAFVPQGEIMRLRVCPQFLGSGDRFAIMRALWRAGIGP
ncbi:MAG: hypothetical protein AAGG56_18910, partial [Pseudomonadota bacterium]